jgi:hypothetical protein
VRTRHGYTVEKAVADWLAEGLPGRAAKTVEANRDALRPLLAVIGTIPLKDLTVSLAAAKALLRYGNALDLLVAKALTLEGVAAVLPSPSLEAIGRPAPRAATHGKATHADGGWFSSDLTSCRISLTAAWNSSLA